MFILICFVCISVGTTATEWNWFIVNNNNNNNYYYYYYYNLVSIDILNELLESRFYVYSYLFCLY